MVCSPQAFGTTEGRLFLFLQMPLSRTFQSAFDAAKAAIGP